MEFDYDTKVFTGGIKSSNAESSLMKDVKRKIIANYILRQCKFYFTISLLGRILIHLRHTHESPKITINICK